MDDDRAKLLRQRRCIGTAAALGGEIAAWLNKRRDADQDAAGLYIGRHKTQLESIESVLGGAADALCREACSSDLKSTPLDVVYQRCRRVDEASAWLQRLWEFYRDRFDQRDTRQDDEQHGRGATRRRGLPPIAPAVRAADEIVWSAYHQVMARAAATAGIGHGPAPLPFIAAEYSPAAIDSSRPLARQLALQIEFPSWDPRLKTVISRLAVPLLVLPSWCAAEPWWLIFIAHEIGHHLLRALQLFPHFAGTIAASSTDASTQDQWRGWTEEVVADAWSVALVGTGAIEALAEVELAPAADLRRASPDGRYPPPVIRIELAARLAVRLGLGRPRVSAAFSLAAHDSDTVVRSLATHLDAVVDAIVAPLPNGLGTLASLAGLDARELLQAEAFWQAELVAGANRLDDRSQGDADERTPTTLESARRIVAGAVKAWKGLADTSSSAEDQAARAERLARFTLGILGKAGPPGERGTALPDGSDPALAVELARVLLGQD